jgi:hypothetical protein
MMVISIWVKNGASNLDSYVANFSLFETGKENVKSFIIHEMHTIETQKEWSLLTGGRCKK